MKARRLAASLLLLAPPATAQKVDEIVAGYVATRGGLERINTVTSLRMTGTLLPAPNEKAPFVLELKRPGKMRIDTTAQGSTFTQATDGKAAWVHSPLLAGGSAVILPPEEAQGLKDQADLDGALVGYAAKGHKVELTGKDTRFGSEAFRLRLTLKSGDVRYLYIDTKTYRQIAEEGERPSPRGLIRIETRLSDHRTVDGLLVPFALEINAGGEERQRLVFDKIEVNPILDDGRFAVPAGAKPAPTPPGSGAASSHPLRTEGSGRS